MIRAQAEILSVLETKTGTTLRLQPDTSDKDASHAKLNMATQISVPKGAPETFKPGQIIALDISTLNPTTPT